MSRWPACRQPRRPQAEDTFPALHAKSCCSNNELLNTLAGSSFKIKEWHIIMNFVLAAGIIADVQIA